MFPNCGIAFKIQIRYLRQCCQIENLDWKTLQKEPTLLTDPWSFIVVAYEKTTII